MQPLNSACNAFRARKEITFTINKVFLRPTLVKVPDPLTMWIGWPLRFLRFLLWDYSGFISPRQDEPVDAIHQLQFMEVDQEAYGDVQQFHVAEQLGLVNRQDLLDRFEFEQ